MSFLFQSLQTKLLKSERADEKRRYSSRFLQLKNLLKNSSNISAVLNMKDDFLKISFDLILVALYNKLDLFLQLIISFKGNCLIENLPSYFVNRAGVRNLSVLHLQQIITQNLCILVVMCGEKNCYLFLSSQLYQQISDEVSHDKVHPSCHLVQQQDVRALND